MKKFNFLTKTFSLCLMLMLVSQFVSAQTSCTQPFIAENAAVVKLQSKVSQLEQTPHSSISYPDGMSVVGDAMAPIRLTYYSAILQKLEEKDQSGNSLYTTRQAYEFAKNRFDAKASGGVDPTSTASGSQFAWLHDEACKLLTN